MERRPKNELFVNPESVDIQLLSGVYQTKSPCLNFEMFGKCPNKSDCPHYHGTFCKFCYQYCLPTWNEAARQAHLSQCYKNEVQKKRWQEAEANMAKLGGEARKQEKFTKLQAMQMIERVKLEQKKMLYKNTVPNLYQQGPI